MKVLPLFAGLVGLFASAAYAQTYPSHPIRMIVPISVGSVTDVAARLTAQELQQRPASRSSSSTSRAPPWCSAAGIREVAGGRLHVMVVSPDTMSFNPLTVPNLPYDPDKDFVPGSTCIVMEGIMVPAASSATRSMRCAPRPPPRRASSITARSANAHHRRFRQWLGEYWHTSFAPSRTRAAARSATRSWKHHRLTKIGVGNMVSSSRPARSKSWRSTPRARAQLPMCRRSRKPGSTAFPAARSTGRVVPTGTPARRRAPARRLAAIIHDQKFLDFARQNYLKPVGN